MIEKLLRHTRKPLVCCAYQGENNLSSHVEERVNERDEREKKVEVRSNCMLSKAQSLRKAINPM